MILGEVTSGSCPIYAQEFPQAYKNSEENPNFLKARQTVK